jgi:sugar/nucleoside kinase (ribokinase family)
MTFDVLTLGSITLDTFIKPQETHIHPDEESGDFFSFQIGEKVKIKTIAKHVGGGSANSSVGFSVMGLKTAAYGTIGGDTHGEFIMHQLQKFDVNTSHIRIEKEHPSSSSIIFMFPDGRRTVFNEKTSTKSFPSLETTNVIYCGHISDAEEEIFAEITNWKQSDSNKIFAWNPGKTQFKKGIKHYADLAAQTDLIVLNNEEAELFTRVKAAKLETKKFAGNLLNPERITKTHIFDSTDQAQAFLDTGIKRIIITDGKKGAQYFDANQSLYIPQLDTTPAISTLGAGDSFSVGAVSALHRGESAENMLRWGSINASSVVKYFGAQNGLLSEADILAAVENL